jgi:hypothetical protein
MAESSRRRVRSYQRRWRAKQASYRRSLESGELGSKRRCAKDAGELTHPFGSPLTVIFSVFPRSNLLSNCVIGIPVPKFLGVSFVHSPTYSRRHQLGSIALFPEHPG